MRLDSYSNMPTGMQEYLEYYGWHFSKKMCEWACSNMYKTSSTGNKEKVSLYTKESLCNAMKKYGIELQDNKGYDDVYVANMCKADYYGSSIVDELRLCKFVKDTIEDPDGYEGMVFTRFYADCIGKGMPILWDDLM